MISTAPLLLRLAGCKRGLSSAQNPVSLHGFNRLYALFLAT
jgi:hypothetical protein